MLNIEFEKVFPDSWIAVEKNGFGLFDPQMVMHCFLNALQDAGDPIAQLISNDTKQVEAYAISLTKDVMFITTNRNRADSAKTFVQMVYRIIDEMEALKNPFEMLSVSDPDSRNCEAKMMEQASMFALFMNLLDKFGDECIKEQIYEINTIASIYFKSAIDTLSPTRTKEYTVLKNASNYVHNGLRYNMGQFDFTEKMDSETGESVIYGGSIGDIYEAIKNTGCHGKIFKNDGDYYFETSDTIVLDDFLHRMNSDTQLPGKGNAKMELVKEL